MSTITKEFIADTIEGLEHLANSGIQSVYIDMAIAGMRRLLASLEAEAVAYADPQAFRNFQAGVARREWMWRNPGEDLIPVYTAPPAPVSLPDESAVELLATDLMKRIDKITGERHSVATLSSLRVSIVESCRAAMLQGADGNSQVIPDGWVLVPVEPTTNQWAAGMQAFDSGVDKVTRVYKAMLAAAPQQEVK